jgi:tRNA (guanine37-N1)-methyltransferase
LKKSSKYLKIDESKAQRLHQFLKKGLISEITLDRSRNVLHEENYVLFPIKLSSFKFKYVKEKLEPQFKCKIVYRASKRYNYRESRSLKAALSKELPKKLLKLVPQSYDIIGDIAILEFEQINNISKKKYVKLKKKVAEILIIINKTISSVYEKKSEIKGQFRLRDFDLISGKDNSETIYKENNCQFKLDIKKTYFSPRLVFERRRIASLNYKEGEKVIDLFAGVGTFSIQIAKSHSVTVHAFDINPVAYLYLQENLRLNKLKGNVIAHQLDVFDLLAPENKTGQALKSQANRIIMNLPEKSIDYLKVACFLLPDSGGLVHIYQFCEKPNAIKKSIEKISIELNKTGWKIQKVINAKIVKAYSPKSDLIVLDLSVYKIIY